MAYSRISDKFKQQNRESNVDKNSLFYIIDSVDIHYAVNGFQSQVATPSTDENYAYIITDPYNLHSNFGGVVGGSGLYEIYGKTVGTGDILRSVRIEERDRLGTTYAIEFDASNQGEKTEESVGNLGQIVFNVFDSKHYGWNGTTWGDLVSDYVKTVTSVGGTITVTKGNGDQTTIDIGITAGVSGDVSNFTKELNFIGGTNADINIGTDSTTSNITFNVSRMEAGTFS